MDDPELMRDILESLISDTGNHLDELERALVEANTRETVRLAHYSKGACASVGATSSAQILQEIERRAAAGDWQGCGASLRALHTELEKLQAEAVNLNF